MNQSGKAQELEFHKLIQVLARVCSFDLDEFTIEQYDKHLSKEFAYAEICIALQDIISERDTRDAFPSVRAIREKIKPSVDEKTAANMIANDIVAKIGPKGRNWGRNFDQSKYESFQQCLIEQFGDVATLVIQRMGGWAKICEVPASKVGFLKKDLHDTALAVIDAAKRNQIDWKPSVQDFLPEREKTTKHLPGNIGMDKMLPEND